MFGLQTNWFGKLVVVKGSVAVASSIAIDKKEDIRCLKLKQPGGEIEVDIEYIDKKINKAIIKGLVLFVSEGKVYLPNLL